MCTRTYLWALLGLFELHFLCIYGPCCLAFLSCIFPVASSSLAIRVICSNVLSDLLAACVCVALAGWSEWKELATLFYMVYVLSRS